MISINIATHKVRQEALRLCLEAILKSNTKADRVNIYLNDYKSPKWLTALKKKHSEINTVNAPEGNIGAAGKFYFATDQKEGVYLTMDDDLIIDKRYIGYMADSAYRYPNCIVGLHGTIYPKWPVQSYYSDPLRKIFYCYHGNDMDRIVDMLGTGCLAFRIEDAPYVASFPESRMTDPYLYVFSQKTKTPLICLTRADGFVKEIPFAQDSAIWKDVQINDSEQTKIINSVAPNRKTYDLRKLKINYNVSDASIEWTHLKVIMDVVHFNMNVVEFGSGKSTEVLSKLCKLTSFEHDEKYHNSELTELRKITSDSQWYDLTKEDIAKVNNADIIIIDGPTGKSGERYNLPIEILEGTNIIFIDDCQRKKDKDLAKKIAKHTNKKIEFITGQKKIMAKIY